MVEETTTVFILAGLYGIYVPFAVGALCAISQESSTTATRLRWITICMLVLITGGLTFQVSIWVLSSVLAQDETLGRDWRQGIVLLTLLEMAECITPLTGTLSDVILAWRCYVLFESRPRLKWAFSFVIFVNTGIGLIIALSNLRVFDAMAWAATSLVLNTGLTGAILVKLVRLSKRDTHHRTNLRFQTVARVVVESSAVAWFGVLVYFVLTVLVVVLDPPPNGLAYVAQVVFVALPMLFGISQTLVTVRTGLSRLVGSQNFESRVVALTTDFGSSLE